MTEDEDGTELSADDRWAAVRTMALLAGLHRLADEVFARDPATARRSPARDGGARAVERKAAPAGVASTEPRP